MAAQGGLRSAILAGMGVTAPPTALEGKHGFWQAFCEAPNIEALFDGWGTRFIASEVAYKLHSCCGLMHTALDAVAQLVSEHGISVDQIDRVAVTTTSAAVRMVGTICEPKDVMEAQFSLPFGVGLNLIKGSNSVGDYVEDSLRDASILALTRKVQVLASTAFDAHYPAVNSASVEIRRADGVSFERTVDFARGTPQNPLTTEEVERKFRSLTAGILPANQADRIVAIVDRLEDLGDVSALTGLLTVPHLSR